MNEILERLIQRMPYPDQMRSFETGEDYVRFMWRGDSFRVSKGFYVEEVSGSILVGSNITIILQKLLQA